MDYREKDIIKNYSFSVKSTSMFLEDPDRGIIITSSR